MSGRVGVEQAVGVEDHGLAQPQLAAVVGQQGPGVDAQERARMPDLLDLPHWWTHPLAARRVAEEWTKFIYYLVQGAYF